MFALATVAKLDFNGFGRYSNAIPFSLLAHAGPQRTRFLGHIFHSLQIRVLPPYEPSEESEKDWNRIILRLRRGRWKLGNIFGKTWVYLSLLHPSTIVFFFVKMGQGIWFGCPSTHG